MPAVPRSSPTPIGPQETVPLPAVEPAAEEGPLIRDDGDHGLIEFYVLAILAITLSVVALGAIGEWWALGVVMALDVAGTAAMTVFLYRMLGDGEGGHL